jgi:hypothetical protein
VSSSATATGGVGGTGLFNFNGGEADGGAGGAAASRSSAVSDGAGDAVSSALAVAGSGGSSNSQDGEGGAGGKATATSVGSKRLVESVFLNALNATNLVLLMGTGSSFAAKNKAPKLQPAGMVALWAAVQAKVGTAKFEAICKSFPSAPIDDNIERLLTLCIERLLTLCKLYLELAEDDATKSSKMPNRPFSRRSISSTLRLFWTRMHQ